MQRLEQIGRKPPQQGILLKGINHPHNRELAHKKSAKKVAIQGHTIQAETCTSLTAAPDAEHDERQHTGEGPEGDFSPVLEHVGVLGPQKNADDPPVEPEHPHDRFG